MPENFLVEYFIEFAVKIVKLTDEIQGKGVLKECYETEYWLELFSKTNIVDSKQCSELKNDCGKIRRILISSINTTKEKYNL